MWRLKIAEEGDDEAYIFSTNQFAGRQTWESDADAGTAQERSQVEAAVNISITTAFIQSHVLTSFGDSKFFFTIALPFGKLSTFRSQHRERMVGRVRPIYHAPKR
ncbi:hypothetical protein L6164_025313 [Bauhinia variegata]|uniref:Uncharacterized protein n=1 Tax=Bauhinia variegata TaxID=167791 RepID=A0ACB9M2S3_BAUVA|nr:hypothetical protein L6164_025313 [Bauhinia variegata]